MEEPEVRTLVRYFLHEGGLIQFTGHRLEPYQKAYLRDRSLTRIVLKSRQIGFSWIFAAEALIHSLLEDGATTLFVSLNQREAAEKVRYAETLHDSLPSRLRGRIRRSGREALEWSNGSRILSFPCRAPRGFSGANVYLDELAFYPDDREVYLGTLPVLSRGGRLTLASTPFGTRGVFWEQVKKHHTTEDTEEHGETLKNHNNGFHVVPWWECSWMINENAENVLSQGGSPCLRASGVNDLSTEQRVERFGSERLKAIYAAMDRESFQQEYECRFLEEAESFIPYAELMPCVQADLRTYEDLTELQESGHSLYAGFDVGRSVHPSELVVLERRPEGEGVVKVMKTLRRTAFDKQRATLLSCLLHGSLRRLSMGATGMGAPLAEDLARAHPLRVEPVTFTAALKERLAMDLKLAIQRRQILLPADRELLNQIRALRRTFGQGGRARYEAGSTAAGAGAETHGDQFWALALAWHASENGHRGGMTARRIGAD